MTDMLPPVTTERAEIEMVRIGENNFPRTRMISGLPPLEMLARISGRDGIAPILVKRDDLTGLGMGGNKVRKLEFYNGKAIADGCDTMLITGAVQSNYVRITAAAARRAGLDCHIQLEDRVEGMDETYRESGNVLLDRLFGATVHYLPVGEDESAADDHLDRISDDLQSKGRKPFVIHLGAGFEPRGALGYVLAAQEVLDQAATAGHKISQVIVPSGSGQTHGGLLTGLRLAGSNLPVTGICVRRDSQAQTERITKITTNLCNLIGKPGLVKPQDIQITDAFLGPGYGKNSPESWSALFRAAQDEGLLLDPVYTSKSFAGALDMAARPDMTGDGAVLWLHTGGTPALFGYQANVEAALVDFNSGQI